MNKNLIESQLLIFNSQRLRTLNKGVLRLLLIIIYSSILSIAMLFIFATPGLVEDWIKVSNGDSIYLNILWFSFTSRAPSEVIGVYLLNISIWAIISFMIFWALIRLIVWVIDGFSSNRNP